jgi:hypothetical protein
LHEQRLKALSGNVTKQMTATQICFLSLAHSADSTDSTTLHTTIALTTDHIDFHPLHIVNQPSTSTASYMHISLSVCQSLHHHIEAVCLYCVVLVGLLFGNSNHNNNGGQGQVSSTNGNGATSGSTGFFQAVRAKLRKSNNNNNNTNNTTLAPASPPVVPTHALGTYGSASTFAPSLLTLPAVATTLTPSKSAVTPNAADHYRYHETLSQSLSGDSAADAEDSKEHRSGSHEREQPRGGSSSLYAENVVRSSNGSGFDEVDGLHTSRSGGSTDEEADSEWSRSNSGSQSSHAARRARELKEDRERWARFEATGRTFDDNEPPLITSGSTTAPHQQLVSARSVSINPSPSFSGSSSGSTSSSDASRRRKHTSNDDVPSAAARNGKKSRKGPGNRSPGGCDYVAKLAALGITNNSNTNKQLQQQQQQTNGKVANEPDAAPMIVTKSTTVTTSVFAESHPFGFVAPTISMPSSSVPAPAFVASVMAQLSAPPPFPSLTVLSSTPLPTTIPSVNGSNGALPILSAFATPSNLSVIKPQPATYTPPSEHSPIHDAWQMDPVSVTSPSAMVGSSPSSTNNNNNHSNGFASPIPAKPRRQQILSSLSGGMPGSPPALMLSTHSTTSTIMRRQQRTNPGAGVLLDPLQRPSSPSLNSHQVDGAVGRSRSPSSTRHGALMSPSISQHHSNGDDNHNRLRRTNQTVQPFQSFDSPIVHVNRNGAAGPANHIISPSRLTTSLAYEEHVTARSFDGTEGILESPELTALHHARRHMFPPSSLLTSPAAAASANGRSLEWSATQMVSPDGGVLSPAANGMPNLDLRKCRSLSNINGSSPRSELSDGGLSSPMSKGGISISGTYSDRSGRISNGDDIDNDSNGNHSRPSSGSSCRPMQRSRSPSSNSSSITRMTAEPIITASQGRAHVAGGKRSSGGAAALIAATAALPPLKFVPKRPGTAAKSVAAKKAPFNSPRPKGESGPFNSPRPSGTVNGIASCNETSDNGAMSPVSIGSKHGSQSRSSIRSFFRS